MRKLQGINYKQLLMPSQQAADLKQRTACLSSALLPITCTICLSNKFQDCATSQRLIHLLPTAPYIGFQSDCWNAVHNIIITIIMPICIKKWWQHWPAHTRAMLACGQRFIKLTYATWHECLHYVDGLLQIDKTRCLECCANGLCCLWNVCSAHPVMQSIHMLHAKCIPSRRARWGMQGFVLHQCSTSFPLSNRSSPWTCWCTTALCPDLNNTRCDKRIGHHHSLSFLKSGGSNNFLVWAAQLCMISRGLQHVSRHATEPTNLSVCTITAGDTLLSILQHLVNVHHHLMQTVVLPPVRPLYDLIKIAVMRRGCTVVMIMQSEVVMWCLQQKICLLQEQRRTNSFTIQSGLNNT